MIELIPAPHEEKFSRLVADYLLKDGCIQLGLEFPRQVEVRLNDYAQGKISYDNLIAILVGGEIISSHFEHGFRPLLQVLPKLYRIDANFGVHGYEEFDCYHDWVFCRDELMLALLREEDSTALIDLYWELVEETRRRNTAIVSRLGELAKEFGKLHVVIGRLHAPDVAYRLKKKFVLKTVTLEDIYMTPLDTSLVLSLRGVDLQNDEIFGFLRRHLEFARQVGRDDREITDMLRDEEVGKKFQLKKYSELAAGS
ncbi:MAG: hypothetical protein ACUVQM_01020 [Candidatus Hadarchaeaceae archaeon]